jgi:hypothetical protein
MMKLALRHPSGLEIEFEGDAEAFDRFAEFLAGDAGSFVRGLNADNAADTQGSELDAEQNGSETSPADLTRPLGHDGLIDPRAVYARWAQVGANTEIERVTVVAQAAVDAGLGGIDYKTIDGLYDDVGQPKPPRFPKAFFNAKERGFLRSVKHGVWAPTIKGQNYARYGTKPSRARRGPAGPPGATGPTGPTGPTGELPPGGGPTGE